ncbi:hypothetical protein GCM10022423_42430 [Flavobacterium ginsengiterrae]|uniref:histidine kinase n=1 Tax=Flavobacterium ginsengiterrae TaxID=871695 RepID=A0ABP7H3V4_9FLAO
MISKNAPFFCFLALFLTLSACKKKDHAFNDSKPGKEKILSLTIKAKSFLDNHKTDSAFYYFNEVKSICDPKTNPEAYIATTNAMAALQQNQNDFIGSKTTLKEVLPYLKLIRDSEQIWYTYTYLGINYLNTYQFKKASRYFNKALDLNINKFKNIESKKNIAEVLIAENKYQEAIQILLSLTDEKEVQSKPKFHAEILDRIGHCYSHYSSDNSEAYRFLNYALQIRMRLKDNEDIAKSYYNLALFYQNKNSDSAKKYMTMSYEKYTLANDIDGRMSALKLIINNSPNPELKKHALKYIILVDSIFEVRQKAKNQFARIKYDSKLQREENLKLKTHKAENELNLERQKNKNIISYIIIVLSLCLILILYYYLTSKANRDKIEAAYNSETRISKKLHDELANDIYHTMAFAENKNLSLAENKEQLLHNLEVIYSRTSDISKENSSIITDENYISSLKEMISGFSTIQINLILNGLDLISWTKIDKNKKITIYRVLQELLVNMRKYSDASVVGVNFKQIEKSILIHYSDNGKGIDMEKIIFKNGLYNVENRILKIRGTIDITSAPNEGFKVLIKIPI